MSNDVMSKLIHDVSFPSVGEYFAVIVLPLEEPFVGINGDGMPVVTMIKKPNNSYEGMIYKCLASDALRVVGQHMYGRYTSKLDPSIFMREKCRFDDVSNIIDVLPFNKE